MSLFCFVLSCLVLIVDSEEILSFAEASAGKQKI